MDITNIVTTPSLLDILSSANTTKSSCLSLLSNLDSQIPNQLPPQSLSQPHPAHLPPAIKNPLHLSLSSLRGLNRRTISTIRDTKSLTASAKAEVDTLHLQLQNLLYEQGHLRSEIAACEGYSHTYTDLPLVDVDEFLDENPDLRERLVDGDEVEMDMIDSKSGLNGDADDEEEVNLVSTQEENKDALPVKADTVTNAQDATTSAPSGTSSIEEGAMQLDAPTNPATTTAAATSGLITPHALMLLRINHELVCRERLEAQRQELLKRKVALVEENRKRREDLRSLDVELERFIEAAGPISRILEREV